MTLQEMSNEVHTYLVDHGWYDQPVSFLEAMALLHSEVSEAVEAWRMWGTKDMTTAANAGGSQKPEGVPSEFADILIRLLDSAKRFGVDLEKEFRTKMDYNHTRPYRHNKRI